MLAHYLNHYANSSPQPPYYPKLNTYINPLPQPHANPSPQTLY